VENNLNIPAVFGLGTLMPKYSYEMAQTLEERGLLKQYLQLVWLDTGSATCDGNCGLCELT